MGFEDEYFGFTDEKKRKKSKKDKEAEDVESFGEDDIDDKYYGYSIEEAPPTDARRVRLNTYLIILIVILCLIFLVSLFMLLFRVRNITVENLTAYSEEEIIKSSGIVYGKHIYSISKPDIEAALISEYTYIKSVRVKRVLPSTLRLIVEEEIPLFYIDGEDGTLFVSRELKVLAVGSGGKDGLISLIPGEYEAPKVGETLKFVSDGDEKACLSFISALTDSGLAGKTVSADLSNRFELKLVYDGRYTVYLGDRLSLVDKLANVLSTISYLERNYGEGVTIGAVYVNSSGRVSFVPGAR